MMHTSKVKVLRGPITFGGWKGRLTLDGDLMTVDGDEAGRSLVISLAEVKRASYNSNNGLWASASVTAGGCGSSQRAGSCQPTARPPATRRTA